MNRLTQLFQSKKSDILNVYFTAGHPTLDSVPTIIQELDHQGVDLIELGMPYSDPLADGETIQKSGEAALKNGMNLKYLFEQVKIARSTSEIPIIAMGYYNQLIQFGVVKFLEECKLAGIDGLIIPDLPMHEYENGFRSHFEANDIKMTFLITPATSEDRIRKADELSSAFLYVVAQSSITGKTGGIQKEQISYFEKIEGMNLKNPRLIGFGIHDRTTYERACQNANGAIIGSAFIRALEKGKNDVKGTIQAFIRGVRD